MVGKPDPEITVHLRSLRPKCNFKAKASAELEDVLAGLSKSAGKPVSGFLWLDSITKSNTRVNSYNTLQDLFKRLKSKLLDSLKASEDEKQYHRLGELEEKRKRANLDDEDAKEWDSLTTIDQDIIPLLDEEDDKLGEHDSEDYDPERIRRERLKKAAQEKADTGARSVRRQVSEESFRTLTLRFTMDKTSAGTALEVTVPFNSEWDDVCDALQHTFKRIVHFKFLNDKKQWVEVRSPTAYLQFKREKSLEWKQQQTTTVVADVHKLPFGSGAFPLIESMEDVMLLGNAHEVIKDRMKIMACVRRPKTAEVSAADEARSLVQATKGADMVLDEVDDLGRNPLHLAVIQELILLVDAILSAPSDARQKLAVAKDHGGKTPLHYANNDSIALSLLKAKADPTITDRSGSTALHTVSNPDVASRLVKAKSFGGAKDAHVNAKDAAGFRF